MYDIDRLARGLIAAGKTAATMAPTWQYVGETLPFLGPTGPLGKVLPGAGLVLDVDLSRMGIHRRLPCVVSRSPFMRALERFMRDQRGAIMTYDDLASARRDGRFQEVSVKKNAIPPAWDAYNIWLSFFRAGGNVPAGAHTSIPGGSAKDRTSAGAFSALLTDPPPGSKKYLIAFGAHTNADLQLVLLCDVLVTAGNINMNTTAPQTINTVPLPRLTNGVGVSFAFEVTATSGPTAANMTVDYTDQDGTSGSVTFFVRPSTSGFYMIPTQQVAILASGDYGVRSVETVTLSAAMGGGTCALYLRKPLLLCGLGYSRSYVERDFTRMPEVLTEIPMNTANVLGCLVAFVQHTFINSGDTVFIMRTVEG